ncbi:hypothetical protein [Robbsia sp. KACC 23696]|uniref:hypothetical protein n=1 Tax=Robbsia sp. KACC 23696 TaxID=3149231 RepID=UPI00325A77A7
MKAWGKIKQTAEIIKDDVKKNIFRLLILFLIIGVLIYLLKQFGGLEKTNYKAWLEILGAVYVLMGSLVAGLAINPSISAANDEAKRLGEIEKNLVTFENSIPDLFRYVREIVEFNKKKCNRKASKCNCIDILFSAVVAYYVCGDIFFGGRCVKSSGCIIS